MRRWAMFVSVITAVLSGTSAWSQATGRITGTITSQSGAPLAGAQVSVQGTALGARTGATGEYAISGVAAGSHTVRVSHVGYAEQTRTVTVAAGQAATASLQLPLQTVQLEGIVAVGYGTQRKATATGAVTAIKGTDIAKAPAANTAQMLSGKLPGLIVVNPSGEPGAEGMSIRIRGSRTLGNNDPLIVIDGVPGRRGGLDRLRPQDIESISVLKDASAAIYGSRAANGVILVTTKRGRSGAPEFSMTFNQGYNQPTRLPEMADAPTYMTMLNEIDMYRNRAPRYSADVIEKHRTGADPWLYPDTDWFGEVIKDRSLQSSADVSLSGGADKVQYYLKLDGFTQDGYYVNSATRYNQYGFRSNIDGQPTDNLSIRFDIAGRLEDRNYPVRSAQSVFRMLMRGKPNLPAFWPNGLPGPDIEFGDNPAVISTPATGYDTDEQYYANGNLGADLRIPGVEGLTIRGNASYDQWFRYRKQWRTPWTLYTWDYRTRDANGEPVLQPARRGFSAPELDQRDDRENKITFNVVTEYKRDLGAHSVGILGGVDQERTDNSNLSAFRKFFVSDQIDQMFAGGDPEKNNSGSAGVGRRHSYFGRANYDYSDKYLVELVGRYEGSYIFPEDKRFAFLPAVSAGWRISEEPFFQSVAPFFNDLKLRGSWGKTGNDRIDEWQYLATYGFGSGYVFGVNQEVKSIFQTRTPNPDVTWEIATQSDIGVDGSMFDNRLSFEFDYFREVRDDILWFRNASVPQTAGLSLPRENIGKVKSGGFDGSITWRQEMASDFAFDVTLNGGYANNEILFWDEAPGAPEWQRSTGRRMNTSLYYQAIGVFKDQAALNEYPTWPGARPGDVRFKDVNEDGKINAEDRVRVNENNEPTLTGGLTVAGRAKNLDFTVFFQGAGGSMQYVQTESGEIGNFMQEFAENRWRPDAPSETNPRTFNRTDEYWLQNANTFWLRDTDYVRLKTVDIGYSLPQGLTGKLAMNGMRIYVSGQNLVTWDKLKLLDPEARSNSLQYYPQARVFNVGASVTF